jgi:hypothetical protein
MKSRALLIASLFIVFSFVSCSRGQMEVIPMKVKVEISRDISLAYDPTIVIGAENAYVNDKDLVIEGPFSFGVNQQSSISDWIGTAFIRDGKLIIPITDRLRVKISK